MQDKMHNSYKNEPRVIKYAKITKYAKDVSRKVREVREER
jgi:hypothetical protein